jgi:hypothetical protein
MRKAQLHSEITRLRELNATITRDRDGLLREVRDAVGGLRADVAGLRDKADSHAKALTRHGSDLARHGDDIAGLAEAVRASLLGRAGDKEAQPDSVTPIAAKRGSKAAG